MAARRPTSPTGSRGAPRPRQPAARGAARPPVPKARPAPSKSSQPAAPRPAGVRPALGRPVTVIAGVAVVLAVMIVPYLRPWLQQRSELADLRGQIAQSQAEVSALQAERLRWEDPAYVKAQARQRLNFVLPGETGYVLTGDVKAASKPLPIVEKDSRPGSGQVWFGKLWQSVQVAGAAGGP